MLQKLLILATLSILPLHSSIDSSPFFIPAERVEELLIYTGLEIDELLESLIPVAKAYAKPPISGYQVGVAALGKSGNIYLGVNLEFPGLPLNSCIHGEQFLVTNARNHAEPELLALAVSAAPCGHCRQFLNEMGSEFLRILMPNQPPIALSELLPSAFGPQDLGIEGNLMTPQDRCRLIIHESALMTAAIEAYEASYSPYSHSKSGIAIETWDGQIYLGSHLENAAFNPSISPLQAAIVALVADMREYSEIRAVALYEDADAHVSQEGQSRNLLRQIAPDALFIVEKGATMECNP